MLMVQCQYCGGEAQLVNSSEVYRKSYGLIWLCRPCDAWVGVHKNSPINQPLGQLANSDLRRIRIIAHNVFDPLWKNNIFNSRSVAYVWLAQQLKISMNECHIGMMDREMCIKVINACNRRKKDG